MKKKFYKVIFTTLLIIGLSGLYINTANAQGQVPTGQPTGITPVPGPTVIPTVTPEATPVVTPEVQKEVISITITQMPTKTNYVKGESLDLTGMVVQGSFVDGSTGNITGYEVIGYNSGQIGTQSLMVLYQNKSAIITVNVTPPKVFNVKAARHDSLSLTLTWDAYSNALRYEVYCLDEATGAYSLINSSTTNSITLNYAPGTIHSYKVRIVENVLGIEYRGEMSDICKAATSPNAVTGLMVTATKTSSITLSWNMVSNASGYLIYRSPAGKENFVLCQKLQATSYMDSKLTSGTSYIYKVCAYVIDENYMGSFSANVDTSTNPSKMDLKYKAGDQKVRLSWSKVNGATSYDIFIEAGTQGYILLDTVTSGSTCSYVAEDLTNGLSYSFYAIAKRTYKNKIYESPASDQILAAAKEIEETSTTGKYFTDYEAFKKSYSYLNIEYFKKYVKYSKSFIIPGLITTNVGGFASTSMCPQGITFAEGYLLVTAYDLKEEENSVIYVMDKATKELLTTIVLPSKPHVGGIAFDGYNLWVTNGSKVSSIAIADINAAVDEGASYAFVNYGSVCPLGITTSFTTFYDGKLWVGTYDELNETQMYSYTIDNIDKQPSLTKNDTITMPNRVQGIAFSEKGTLYISRSCQLYKGLRGYMRQIDVYNPMKDEEGEIKLGELVNSVSMPSMNEGIAIDGSYLYVNFESAAFKNASYIMDRICAFKLKDVTNKKAL